jgi:hypothetical protein
MFTKQQADEIIALAKQQGKPYGTGSFNDCFVVEHEGKKLAVILPVEKSNRQPDQIKKAATERAEAGDVNNMLFEKGVNVAKVHYASTDVVIQDYIDGDQLYVHKHKFFKNKIGDITAEQGNDLTNEYNMKSVERIGTLDQAVFDKLFADLQTCAQNGIGLDPNAENFIISPDNKGIALIDLAKTAGKTNPSMNSSAEVMKCMCTVLTSGPLVDLIRQEHLRNETHINRVRELFQPIIRKLAVTAKGAGLAKEDFVDMVNDILQGLNNFRKTEKTTAESL